MLSANADRNDVRENDDREKLIQVQSMGTLSSHGVTSNDRRVAFKAEKSIPHVWKRVCFWDSLFTTSKASALLMMLESDSKYFCVQTLFLIEI